jgi:hypothetical protein
MRIPERVGFRSEWFSKEVTTMNRYLLTLALLAGSSILSAQSVSFQRYDLAAGVGPTSVVVGDLNNDGKPDVAVGASAGIYILLGNGDGTFQTPLQFSLPQQPSSVDFNFASRHLVVADFNGDGKLDLAEGNSAVVLLGNGDGTFQAPVSYGVPGPLAVGDLNGDGRPDLAIKRVGGGVSILLSNGDGTFRAETKVPSGLGRGGGIVIADFNGDGMLDLAVGDPDGFTILLGKGDGTFASPACGGTCSGAGGRPLAAGDLNGDGKVDLVSSFGLDRVRAEAFLGNGDGTFRTGQAFLHLGEDPTPAVIADLNGDGKRDLVFGYGGFTLDGDYQSVTILLGNGDGTFGAAMWVGVGERPSSIAVGDFNGDSKPDLVVANENANSISVLINHGDSAFPTVVSAAGFNSNVAPESLASVFGQPLPTQSTASGDPQAPPTTLAGITIQVRDHLGAERRAPLLYASPTRATFQIPAETAVGDATITITGAAGPPVSGTAQIQTVAPALFVVDQDIPAAFAVRIEPDGTRTLLSVFHCSNFCSLDPIVLDERPVYLSLLGTGIRNRTALSSVVCTIAGSSVPVEYAGPAPEMTGVDQVNVRLTRALKTGGSTSSLILTVDGLTANLAYIAVLEKQ